MPKKRPDYVIFDEPLIDISMEPTEEVDPLFIDPTADITAESITQDGDDEVLLNGLNIFSPKVSIKKTFTPIKDREEVKIKKEVVETEGVKVKEEPKDPDDDFELDLPREEETDPAEVLAQVLDKVEFLCPRCTFRSTDKEEVTQHFVSSHRIFQVGIPRPCDKCDYIAKTVRELAAHKKASHPRSYILDNLPTLPTGEFKCPHCDFMSFHKNNVRSHMKVHTQDTVYTCDKCPYTAISRLNIENHAARHLIKSRRKWKFKCKHCGLLERTEKLLQRHLILHGEGEMVKCQLCSYKSPYNHIISMHTRICHGIVGKRTWDKEEKWKMRVRKSTRQCARKRYGDDMEEDFQEEEFLELPVRRTNRGRKKKICDTKKELDEGDVKLERPPAEDEKSHETMNSSETINKTEGEADIPRRPTLEERLGRARELINRNLSRKKRTVEGADDGEVGDDGKGKVENKSDTVKKRDKVGNEESEEDVRSTRSGSEDDNRTDENSENPSDDEDSGDKEEEWSEGESEFYPDTAEESMQSSASDRAPVDHSATSLRDTENSMTGSESLSRAGSSERQLHRRTSSSNKRKRKSNSDNEREHSDSENSHKRNRLDPESAGPDSSVHDNTDTRSPQPSTANTENPSMEPSENLNDEQQDESVRLVLKRKGSSFTCVQKNNTDAL